jgi:hypothetical protein
MGKPESPIKPVDSAVPAVQPADSMTPGGTVPSITPAPTLPVEAPAVAPLSVPGSTTPAPDATTSPASPVTPDPAGSPAVQPTAPAETMPASPAAAPVEQSTDTSAQPSVTTKVLDKESITGIKEVTLPATVAQPSNFTLPIELKVEKADAVTSDSPITDKMARDLPNWASAVRSCLQDRPALVRVVDDQQVPFMVGGTEGKIKLNANNKPVCTASL